jgi:hypothetical protein
MERSGAGLFEEAVEVAVLATQCGARERELGI